MPESAPPTEPVTGWEADGLDEKKATRNLWHGLIAMVVLVGMVVGLLLEVPGLHDVQQQILRMPIGWVVLALALEVLSCMGYVVAFLQVFERAPFRFGARVALSELAFGAAVAVGGAGSVAVGAWLLIERGAKPGRVAERSAVLFLLTSGVNVITLAIAGLGAWLGILPGSRDPLLTLVPGLVGVLTLVGFLSLPWFAQHFIVNRFEGRAARWALAISDTIRETARLLFSADWRLVGAFGYLWFDIAVLWVCFRALGTTPPVAVVVLAYQIGYLSNLIPIPGGIGVLDGSFVGMFVLYHVNDTLATSATIVYHAISLWVPATWGTIAFLLLRRSRNEPIKWRLKRGEQPADS
ncbi:MAG: flippase-like domain-containing protein [Conexibacteraceae bacterium]|nr:flippase-like domain-containing protein [Conexibacteraceae bacterium]